MFFRRLWFTYLIIITISLLITAIVTGTMVSDRINNDVRNATVQTIKQTSINISNILDSLKNTSNFVAMNQNIQDNLTHKSKGIRGVNAEVAQINNELSYQGIFNNKYSSIELFVLHKKNYPLLYLPNHVMDAGVIQAKDWYQKTVGRKGLFYWHVTNEFGTPQISVSRLIGNLKDFNKPIAVLKVNIDLTKVESLLSDIKLGKTGKVYLLDDKYRQILPQENSFINIDQMSFGNDYGNKFVTIGGRSMMVTYRTLPLNDWKLVGMMPTGEISEKGYIFKSIIYSIAFVSFILALVASFYFSYNIARPITSLANTMENIDEGNLNITVETSAKGEVGLLYNNFNHMIRMINELIQKVYVSEIAQKDAELKALQAQINPHFLYNTLNSINWMALKYNATDISQMVRALSSLLRYSLDNSATDKVISVKDEIQQLNNYLTIQSIRFPDKFEVIINIDTVIYECKMIKLLLQPLVENSIIHGIETYGKKCFIEIKAILEDEEVIFEVINNGHLIDLNKVNALLMSKDVPKGISGIQNVNNRIKLYYGDSFGLQYSISEQKTIARIRIPAAI